MAFQEGVRDVFEENEPQHHVLVLRRVHVAAQSVGGCPQLRLEAGADVAFGGDGRLAVLRLRFRRRGLPLAPAGEFGARRSSRVAQQALDDLALAPFGVHARRRADAAQVARAQERQQCPRRRAARSLEARSHRGRGALVHALGQVEARQGRLQGVAPHRFQDG